MKQARYRFIFITATAVLVVAGSLASCTKNKQEPNKENGQITISAAVGTSNAVSNSTYNNSMQSKAPALAIDELELSFARADETASGTYGTYSSTPLTATRAAGAGAQSLTFDPLQYYRTSGLKTKFTGWYPQGTYNGTTNTVSWTINGQQDIMTAPIQEGSMASAMQSATFDHRLSQLCFHPYAETQIISDSWGKITRIDVLSQQNTATYALSDDATGAVSFSGAATNTFSAGVPDAGVAISLSTMANKTTDAKQIGNAVMIAPQSSSEYTLALRVYTDKNRMKTITLKQSLQAGVPYRLYLRFKERDITIETQVVQWNNMDITSEYIGSAGRPINPPTVSDYITIGSLRWTKGNLVAKNTNECKVGAPTDCGVYFHFGSLVGWTGGENGDGVGTGTPALAIKVKPSVYAGSTSWSAGYFVGGTASTDYGLPYTDNAATGIGDPCRYYLGAPWRMPTAAENKTLFAGVGNFTVWNNVAGWSWQTTPAVGAICSNSMFFPASGYRNHSDGNINTVNANGYIWSSSIYSGDRGYSLSVYYDTAAPQSTDYRTYGLPVRCVSE